MVCVVVGTTNTLQIDMGAAMSNPATRLLDDAGPTVSIRDTARVLGISRQHAYALAQRGELGVRVLRLGSRMVVPTIELRRLVGLDEKGEPAA
jgi:hypothetical protein